MSDSLRPHGLQHDRLPCPSLSPGVCSNSCPLSQWCHPTISSSVFPFFSCPQSLPASVSFSNELAPHIRWPKDWSFSFSISPSNEYSGLISFRMDWLDLLAVQGKNVSLATISRSHTGSLTPRAGPAIGFPNQTGGEPWSSHWPDGFHPRMSLMEIQQHSSWRHLGLCQCPRFPYCNFFFLQKFMCLAK